MCRSKTLNAALCMVMSSSFALEKMYGFSVGSSENVTEVNYHGSGTQNISAMSTQTGNASFSVSHFFGLKQLKEDGFFHSYQIDLGYNTLNHNAFSATFNGETNPLSLKIKSGAYYGLSTRFGLERGDYSLYAITGLRLSEWEVTANNGSSTTVLGLSAGSYEVFKKTSSSPIIGAGIHLVISDTIHALFEQLYLPTESNNRNTDTSQYWSNSLTQYVTSVSLVF